MKRVSKNASGKYVQMNDEQIAREQAKFERAVERQRQRDVEAARRAKEIK